MTRTILTAARIVTMDDERSVADAVAVIDGVISAVGSLADCRAVAPDADEHHLGDAVLLPGFIEPHSHPLLSGVSTMPPAGYIAPWVAPDWDAIVAVFRTAIAAAPAHETPLAFFGFDQLLHGCAAPDASVLDDIFGDRMVVVINNSGHAAYATTALLRHLGWDVVPPADPVGGHFDRGPDGRLTGVATESPAVFAFANPVLHVLSAHPLHSGALYYAQLAAAGVTSAAELAFESSQRGGYEALAQMPGCPLRMSLYHMSTDPDCGAPLTTTAPESMLAKRGLKLWTDGSPWIGNVATSFGYLDTPAVRRAGIPPDPGGLAAMNYTPEQLDAILDAHVPQGWQMSFHVNGDLAFDVLLDAYERALTKHGLLGTDHRWRAEHLGAVREPAMQRAGELGVVVSMSPFQLYYWGDLLDGQMFATEIGSHWQQFREAFDAGLHPSFHNDGSVSPPTPLLNMQTAVTRTSSSGAVHGPEHAVSIDEALCAHTRNAAYALRRDDVLGSIEVGKWADFVALSADPYAVDPARLATDITVLGTWLGGDCVDLDSFVAATAETDPAPHAHLRGAMPACCAGSHTHA